MADGRLRGMGQVMGGIDPGNRSPDQTGGQQHRLGFAHVGEFFHHDQQVGEDKDGQGEKAHPVPGQVQPLPFAFARPGRAGQRQQREQQQRKRLEHGNSSATPFFLSYCLVF